MLLPLSFTLSCLFGSFGEHKGKYCYKEKGNCTGNSCSGVSPLSRRVFLSKSPISSIERHTKKGSPIEKSRTN
nr:MAG TPA: hypothetical protein [Caudoviricetes sp.]DAX29820.1 MAG TPA: hypothetical protein [Caudoviricetes sp.]